MKLGLGAALLAALLCIAPSAYAECVAAPEWTPEAALNDHALGPTRNDRRGRVVAPITINGQGPFRFIVDTGANRSAVSNRLAAQLALPGAGQGEVHSVHGVSTAAIVNVETLRYGDLTLPTAPLPILSDEVLAGEHGLLGVDGMQGRRLLMDFERRCIEIGTSRATRTLGPNWTMVRGDLRFGHLIVLRARMSGIEVNVLLDTGSDSTLANNALREALAARMRRSESATTAHTAGESIPLENVMPVRDIRMGNLQIRDVTAYVGDFYIFQLWGLTDEPTLLMGMDVLSQAGALTIDYGRSEVLFRARRVARRAAAP